MSRARLRLTGALLALTPLLMQSGHLVTAAKADTGDTPSVVWIEDALQGIRDAGGQNAPNKMGPPMIARALAIISTCAYDAWAAYDPVALGTQLGGTLRRPDAEMTDANKTEAMSFAAYRALVDLMPVDKPLYDATMAAYGFDPTDTSTDVTTPQGIGNVACAAVLNFRHHDGSNQLGDLHAPAYSDYTGYKPVNEPMVVTQPINIKAVHDPNRWQPLTYVDPTGKTVTPKAVAKQWGHVIPFAMTSDDEFQSPLGPAKYGSVQYLKSALELVLIQAQLTDQQKMIAEYWADGPNSEQPPGHFGGLFGAFVSRRDHHTIDQDAKMFFALDNSVFDAGIVAWGNKAFYDSVRPITQIRYLFNGIPIPMWGGPGQGTVLRDGGTWTPYQAPWFPTPPFPAYSSGHSNFSAAGSEILKRFSGSDNFGFSVTFPAGSSKFEPGVTPASDVTINYATFTQAADDAGMSRRYGGIHVEQDDLDARATGRLVASQVWAKAEKLWNGIA